MAFVTSNQMSVRSRLISFVFADIDRADILGAAHTSHRTLLSIVTTQTSRHIAEDESNQLRSSSSSTLLMWTGSCGEN